MAAPTPQCPRCARPVTPGLRACPSCGFDLIWDQGLVSTVDVPSGAFMTTVGAGGPPPAVPAPLLLEQLRRATEGEYEVLEELGRGGMATVYLARDLALDRKVALKVISPAVIEGPETVERFKREARTAASLSHPGIIPIHAVREQDHVLFFVMKFVDGRTLATLLRGHGPMPIAVVRAILAGVANALDHAHRNGVIHRDVKPGNIMVDVEGHVMVTDFGIAKVADVQGLTQTGRTIGTPTYMSPEACQGREVTAASDQYALGVVGYELLVGRNPFLSDSAMSAMYAQIHEAPQPVRELRPDCPPELADAVMRMLEKDPGRRWPNLRDAAIAVMGTSTISTEVLATLGGMADRRTSRPGTSPASMATLIPRRTPVAQGVMRRRRRGWLWAGLVLVLGLSVAWALARREPPPADPVPTGADSAVAAARAAAAVSRARARAAGIPAAVLAEGDSIHAEAEAMAAEGRNLDGAALFAAAAAVWDSAAQTASGGLGRRPDTSPGAPAGDTAAPEAPVSDSAAIMAYYERLAQAIEARQLGEVRRLLPNMTDYDAQAWRRIFEDRNVDAIDASYQVLAIGSDGSLANARIATTLSVTKRGRPDPKTREYYATLTLGPEGWREIRADD